MWTPKRILIFLGASVGFLLLFGAVVLVVGGVDGLPPLPPHYVANLDDVVIEPPPVTEAAHEFKVRQAFGNESEELKRKSKVFLASKGAVLAVNEFEIQKDGRVKVWPFSVGLFPKTTGDPRFPEVHTVQCDYALLTLDRPVASLHEIGGRKLVGVELGGESGVKITNNRKTQEKNDDLELYVSGKLFYEEARSLIWSNSYVKLLDTQSQPLPTQVTAVGMEVMLNKDTGPNRDKKAAPSGKKDDGVSGVEKIKLLGNVDMHLYTDANSGFMAGSEDATKKPKTPKAKKEPQEKAHVHIKTNGPFLLDLVKDTARFDGPEQTSLTDDRVIATRHVAAKAPKGGILTDVIKCDRLDLQFRKKAGATPGSTEKDIESAIATGRPETIVELHATGEELHAFGAEMRYYAPDAKSGPRTIIKGTPMHALRQGHQIRCVELHLKGADKNGDGQEAFAKGPGKIDLLDKQTGKYSTHILFKNSFIAHKDKDGNRVFDLLTLNGDAAFIDEEHKQELHAKQVLHVWLETVKAPVAKTPPPPLAPPPIQLPPVAETPGTVPGTLTSLPAQAKSESAPSTKQRPYKIQAFEKVLVLSPDMNIREANSLTVYFREGEVVAAAKEIPVLPIGPQPGNGPAGEKDGKNDKDTKVDPTKKMDPKEKIKPRHPLEITGSTITAYIDMIESKKELRGFVAEGNAHVTKEADNPKDKGLDIVGAMLRLTRKPAGDLLEVFGDKLKLAQLQQNEMILFGPIITINQIDNVATVDGTGAMRMPSNTTLDGKKKDGHVTVHWNEKMVFNGRYAYFEGGVEAFQGNGKLRSQSMQVTLDQPVDFKQTKGTQNAKIDKILCGTERDSRVYVIEEERDKANKIETYRRLIGAGLEVDNLEQRVTSSGPGVLDAIGRSAAGDPVAAPKTPAKEEKKSEQILKWTRVRFEGQMMSYPSATGNGRQTIFIDQVRVYHQPGEDPNVRDPNEIVKDGLFFTCQKLTLIQRKVGTKSSQEMIAEGGTGLVNFQTEDFHGNAKTVKYDETNETIIFEGAPATLYKMPKIRGLQPQRIQGSKILYNRKTGEFLLDGVTVISSWLMTEEPVFLTMNRDGVSQAVALGEGGRPPSGRLGSLLRFDAQREDQPFAARRLIARDDG